MGVGGPQNQNFVMVLGYGQQIFADNFFRKNALFLRFYPIKSVFGGWAPYGGRGRPK